VRVTGWLLQFPAGESIFRTTVGRMGSPPELRAGGSDSFFEAQISHVWEDAQGGSALAG
jgi:hypothetical protein